MDFRHGIITGKHKKNPQFIRVNNYAQLHVCMGTSYSSGYVVTAHIYEAHSTQVLCSYAAVTANSNATYLEMRFEEHFNHHPDFGTNAEFS